MSRVFSAAVEAKFKARFCPPNSFASSNKSGFLIAKLEEIQRGQNCHPGEHQKIAAKSTFIPPSNMVIIIRHKYHQSLTPHPAFSVEQVDLKRNSKAQIKAIVYTRLSKAKAYRQSFGLGLRDFDGKKEYIIYYCKHRMCVCIVYRFIYRFYSIIDARLSCIG